MAEGDSPEFGIEKELIGDVVILHVRGKLVKPDGIAALEEGLDKLVGERHHKLIFDLRHLSHAHSDCIRPMLRAWGMVRKKGGYVRWVVEPWSDVAALFRISRIDPMPRVFHTLEDALADVGQVR